MLSAPRHELKRGHQKRCNVNIKYLCGIVVSWNCKTRDIQSGCPFFVDEMEKETDPFYKSVRWKRKREKILRRDGYQCQYYRRYGKARQASTVHHIFPREQFPEYEWADWNLVSLSLDAHNKMHERDTHELTKTGKDLLRRTARRQGICLHLS